MADDKLWTLVKRLAARTKAGLVDWERTIEENCFQASFGDYVVKIATYEPDSGGAPDIYLRIYDDAGNLMEEIVDTQFSQRDSFLLMHELMQAARRRAFGADRAIDDILGQLGDDDVADAADFGPKGVPDVIPPEDEIPF